ncbi:MAG: hypothetical protein ACXQTV_03850, partial [Candidatus Hecatellaceae archaeon]
IFRVIARLRDELNLTILVVEHRLEALAPLADRIIIMDEGTIVLNGEPGEVLSIASEKLSHKIGVPKPIILHEKLRRRGFPLGSPPLTVEELAEKLRRLLVS